jgi:hypothetical protein
LDVILPQRQLISTVFMQDGQGPVWQISGQEWPHASILSQGLEQLGIGSVQLVLGMLDISERSVLPHEQWVTTSGERGQCGGWASWGWQGC